MDVDASLLAAADDACRWLEQFGWNVYGVAVSDDWPDHKPVAQRLRSAIRCCQSQGAARPGSPGSTAQKRAIRLGPACPYIEDFHAV